MLSGGSHLSSVRRFKTADFLITRFNPDDLPFHRLAKAATTSIATAPIRHSDPGVTEATNALTAGICITVK